MDINGTEINSCAETVPLDGRRNPPKDTAVFVYYIQIEGFIKIGMGGDWKKRVRLSTGLISDDHSSECRRTG